MPKRIANTKHKNQACGDWFFGAPPLFSHEDPRAYRELLKQVTDAVRPLDIFERFWIRDIVDLMWEILRLRRDTVKLLEVNDGEKLKYLDAAAVRIDRIAKIDEVIGWAEARRNIAYHELKQHRTTFATLLREKLREISSDGASENAWAADNQAVIAKEHSQLAVGPRIADKGPIQGPHHGSSDTPEPHSEPTS